MNALFSAILEHVLITATAVLSAAVIGVLLGILISKKHFLASPILAGADVIQTIPSLALLAILMVLFGLGNKAVIIGLCLYSLLPIIRNTYTGLNSVSPSVVEAARGMGMSWVQSLVRIELPLALPLVFAGIRIAFVTALGTAVIGVLVGSGGLGYIIYTGIQTQDWSMILEGTLPLVILACLVQFGFNKIQTRKRKGEKVNV